MSAASSSSTPAAAAPSPLVPLARGLLLIFDLWPALRLAIAEEWGGPETAEKRTWMASEVVDYFESNMPAAAVISAGGEPALAALEAVADVDDIAEMLHNMMADEFDTDLEDGSPDEVAKNLVALWRALVRGDNSVLETLEGLVKKGKGKKVQATRQGSEQEYDEDGNAVEDDADEDWDDEDGEEEGDVDMDEEAPQLVEREKKPEPVVDDDGFTLVQGKGKKGR